MVKRIGGLRRKTRNTFKKKAREKGKLSISSFFQEFKAGDRVLLKADPAHQKGLYHPRFHAKSGIVERSKGKCYEVRIKDQQKEKTVVVHPVHLRRL